MVQMFSQNEILIAQKRRRILLICFIAFSVVMWAVNLILLFAFLDRAMGKTAATALNVVVTSIWGGVTLFVFAVKYPPIKHFYRMLKNITNGLKDDVTLRFIEWGKTVVTKDGVEFVTMRMRVKPNKLGLTEGERNVLVEKSRTMPPLAEGDLVQIRTHANILTEYQIH